MGTMAKAMKGIIKYKNSVLPENLEQILGNADETDLKILIALMMASNESGEFSDAGDVGTALGLDSSDIDASIKFWRGAGIVASVSGASRQRKKDDATPEKKEGVPAKSVFAHKNGVLESADDANYGSAELADLFERRTVTAEFIDEAQRVFGKTFNSYDTGIVVGLIDRLGLEEEAVLAILAYVKRRGKRGLRYTEKVALALYDDGYTETREIVARIAEIERSAEETVKIKRLLGMGERELSSKEKTLFEKWTQRFGYDTEIIRIAYDKTVDAIQKPVPSYIGAILEKWYAEGLRTPDEIEAYEKSRKEQKDGAATEAKSYDLDDFFEAALQRSFEDHKNT